MPSTDRTISEENAPSRTVTGEKSPMLPSARPLELSSAASLCFFLYLFHITLLTHQHTRRVACKDPGLGSGEVDCSPPRGFLRMKFGVMAVSTISLMLIVYDLGRAGTQKHTDEEISPRSLRASNIFFPEMPQCAPARRFIKMCPFRCCTAFYFLHFTFTFCHVIAN